MIRHRSLLQQVLLLALASSLVACAFAPKPGAKALVLPAVLSESSGLLCVAEEFISFNDSGGASLLYRINTKGQIRSQLELSVTNIDWEAAASDGQFLYLADSGNNAGKRSSLLIHKIPLDWTLLQQPFQPQTLEIQLPSRGELKPHQHDLDFEALVYQQGALWLISKSWQSQIPALYTLDPNLAVQKLGHAIPFAAPGFLVTDAVFDHKAQHWWLVGYTDPRKAIWAFLTQSGFQAQIASYDKNLLLLESTTLPTTGQVEGVCIDQKQQIWISEEGSAEKAAQLMTVGYSGQ